MAAPAGHLYNCNFTQAETKPGYMEEGGDKGGIIQTRVLLVKNLVSAAECLLKGNV